MPSEKPLDPPKSTAAVNPPSPAPTTPEGPGHLPGHAQPGRWGNVGMALGALGVVYGDIGTSPLYAFRESFIPPHGVAPTPENVLGLLSLFFWSLTLVVGVKYLTFVLRADNQGEGGILALLALVAPAHKPERKTALRAAFILVGLFGAALLAADSMITPAITVLGAIEGLEVATTQLNHFVVPITVLILLALFVVQRHGTGRIAAIFGPAMLVWFFCITAVAIPWIFRQPAVLACVNPWHAVNFFREHQLHGLLVLGAVVLCITGTEALYADMGHFGKRPIRMAWFAVAYPALLCNYFGQGAYILNLASRAPIARESVNPFYGMAEGILLYPMMIIATIAAIVASQALISGAFSLAQQAVQMGYSPRLTIVHTSSETRGQIYVPEVNTLLMVACVALAIAFQRSSALAAAYGIAVTGTMTITSLLLYAVMRRRWGWSLARAGGLTVLFLVIDLIFFSANFNKLWHGGWFPLAVAVGVFTIMSTWKTGRARLRESLQRATLPLERFLSSVERNPPIRVPGIAVFMTSDPDGTPVVLMHHFKHNKVLHEKIILLCAITQDVPEVPAEQRVILRNRGNGFYQVTAHYGFMQTPNIPEMFRACTRKGLELVPREASFYLGRETLIVTTRPGMARWRKALFEVLSRNARSATAYFDIPSNRVVELGTQIEL